VSGIGSSESSAVDAVVVALSLLPSIFAASKSTSMKLSVFLMISRASSSLRSLPYLGSQKLFADLICSSEMG